MDVEQMLALAPAFAAALGISQTMPDTPAPEGAALTMHDSAPAVADCVH